MNAGAVAIDVGADCAAVEAEHRLVRQNERDRIMIGRAAARRPRLLAELAITKFALTDTPEPELDPSEAERVVSYGLDGLPAQVLR